MKIVRAKVLGYCMGVRRAADAVETALKNDTHVPVFTFGPLIHNHTALEDLRQRGVQILSEETLVPLREKAIVVIRAHGVPPFIREKLAAAGYDIVNATCPRVLSSQKLAADYSAKGYTVIIAGDKNHGEVSGIAGCVCGHCITVESVDDAHAIEPIDGKAVLIAQTTITDEEYGAIACALEKKNPALHVCKTICSATIERQKVLETLCAQVDGVLVIGGKNSANTARLFKTAAKLCKHAAHIETASEIPAVFFTLDRVGLSAGASTPDTVILEVERCLQKNSVR